MARYLVKTTGALQGTRIPGRNWDEAKKMKTGLLPDFEDACALWPKHSILTPYHYHHQFQKEHCFN